MQKKSKRLRACAPANAIDSMIQRKTGADSFLCVVGSACPSHSLNIVNTITSGWDDIMNDPHIGKYHLEDT